MVLFTMEIIRNDKTKSNDMLDKKQYLRDLLLETRAKYDLKIQHFNALHSVAKHMKPEIRELAKQIDDIEKQINKKK